MDGGFTLVLGKRFPADQAADDDLKLGDLICRHHVRKEQRRFAGAGLAAALNAVGDLLLRQLLQAFQQVLVEVDAV